MVHRMDPRGRALWIVCATRFRRRHYSVPTETTCVQWTRWFILFHSKRHPDEMGAAEVSAFLRALATRGQVAASTQNQALNALVFLYRQVLGRELGEIDAIVRAKRPHRLPVVLSEVEVSRLLSNLIGEPRLVACLLYGGGLRLLDGVSLRVKDLDLGRGEILVRDGKGRKDRVTVLPRALDAELRQQLEHAREVWQDDLRRGSCGVALPDALARKYPSAPREWGWQWVFPATQLCDSLARARVRHPHRAGVTRPPRRPHHDDLDARAEPRWPRCAEPTRSAVAPSR
jgi:integron integrase